MCAVVCPAGSPLFCVHESFTDNSFFVEDQRALCQNIKRLYHVLKLNSYQTSWNKIIHLIICNTYPKEQRTFFYTKNSKNLISKMATISSSVLNAMKITPTVAKSAANGSKILTRGSFFDPESQKAFLDKHQQKNTPKITTCSTWSSMNSNSKTSEKWFLTSVNYW